MRELLAELRRRDPLLHACGRVSLLALLVALLLAAVDDRTLLGAGVWLKPGKFAASIGLYLWTLAWLRPHLDARALRWARPVIAATMIVELICIFGQAARGVSSHFNVDAPADAIVFAIMGLAIVLNTVALAALAVAAWRRPPARAPAFVWGLRLGLTITVLGGLEGQLMVQRMGHSVGVPDGGPGLPLTHWSTRGGDLRIAHFLALHALQLLVLAGGWLARRAGEDPARQTRALRIVQLLGALWLALCLGALALALLGRPLLRA